MNLPFFILKIKTDKKFFYHKLFLTIFLTILTLVLDTYIFKSYNFFHVLVVLWVLVFILEHIRIKQAKPRKEVKIKTEIEKIFVNVVNTNKPVQTDVKDVKNRDKIEINSGDIVRVKGVIKNGIGMFKNEKTHKKRGDLVECNSVLEEGKVVYEVHI